MAAEAATAAAAVDAAAEGATVVAKEASAHSNSLATWEHTAIRTAITP